MHKVYENWLHSSSEEEELVITDNYKLNQTSPRNVKGKYCFGVNRQIYSLHGTWWSLFFLPSTVKTKPGLSCLVWSLNGTKYLVETVSKISSKNEQKSRKSDLLDRQEGLEMLCWKAPLGKETVQLLLQKRGKKEEPVLHLTSGWL